MRLRLLLPDRVLIDCCADRVSAESVYGTFTVLPKHIDFVTTLTTGLLSFQDCDGETEHLAVDEGICVKAGDEITVTTSNAFRDRDLGRLKELISSQFENLNERERKARSASVRLESDFIRRFMEFQE